MGLTYLLRDHTWVPNPEQVLRLTRALLAFPPRLITDPGISTNLDDLAYKQYSPPGALGRSIIRLLGPLTIFLSAVARDSSTEKPGPRGVVG